MRPRHEWGLQVDGGVMGLSVILVKRDPAVCERLAEHLGQSGFRVRWATSLAQAEMLMLEPAELVVVDAYLLDGAGLAFGRRLRSYLGCGVILCVAEADKALRIACLREGADACLVHPVDPEELEATLISVHRCLHSPAPKLVSTPVPSPWVLDPASHLLRAPSGRSMTLNLFEHCLLRTLFGDPERRVSRGTLVAELTAVTPGYTEARLEALVSRLRAKAAVKCGMKLPLVSSYGHGYRFNGHVRIL